jgi:hypothetical protein
MKIVLCSSGGLIGPTKLSERDKFDRLFECYNQLDILLDLKNRPLLEYLWSGDNYVRMLKQEIHDWLTHYDITYSLSVEHDTSKIPDDEYFRTFNIIHWCVDIPEDIVMLFKLTWM